MSSCKKKKKRAIKKYLQLAQRGDEEALREMLAKPSSSSSFCTVSPDARDGNGNSAAHRAAEGGSLPVLRMLFESFGLDVRTCVNREFKTCLHCACQNGQYECAKYLLDSGADPDALKRNRWTPLMHAVAKGHERVAKLLLRYGAKIDERNKEDATALYVACRDGRIKCVALLLDAGADVNCMQRNKRTCVHAAIQNGHKDVLSFLIKRGARVKGVRDSAGATALHECAYSGRTACAKLLLDNGHIPKPEDAYFDAFGRHPFHAAAMHGHVDMLKLLLPFVSTVDLRDGLQGGSALFWAATEGQANAVTFLLSKGASVHVKTDKFGRTPLHAAVSWKRKECCALLLTAGASVLAKEDKTGRCALDIITTSDEIREMLESARKSLDAP